VAAPEKVRRLIEVDEVLPALRRRGTRWIAPVIERALALDVVNHVEMSTRGIQNPADGIRAALAGFGVRYEVRPEELARIPREGPVVVVSNHPFGGIDAIILTTMLADYRADARVMANHLLERVPQVSPLLIPVDVFGGPGAARRNLRGMKLALSHLQKGGLLGIFPSGTVSHFQWRRMAIEDPEWTTHLFSLVRRSGATVVPAYFPGRNNMLFQAAGLIHPLLRTAFIPRAAARRRGETLRVVIGRPIPAARLRHFEDPREFTQFLRMRTYVLAGAAGHSNHTEPAPPAGAFTGDAQALAPAENAGLLEAEIAAIPPEDVLVRDGAFVVAVTRAGRSPTLLREIGRLREETFRSAGEGSGHARDLDKYDEHYEQLILWDAVDLRIAGGYRVARTLEVIERHGTRGLYTARLFRIRRGLFDRLGPALELGRSWIHPDYQRRHNALALLWRGIGALVVRKPECAMLLGAVSISRSYQPLSRGLIVSFLKQALLDRRLASFMHPPKPYRVPGRFARLTRAIGRSVKSIDDVSLFVSEIEADGKGVPVLFRHYLRLHSTVLSFNVDPAFAGVVDGLIVTDLRRTNPHLVRRFMGAEGYARFAAHHGLPDTR
jgi:putative hemolysin